MLKVYTFNRKKLLYDPVWSFLATAVHTEFNGHHDSYVMMAFIIKCVYPKKYFRFDFNFAAKNTETGLFTKYVEKFIPDLASSLTTNKVTFDRTTEVEEITETNYPFEVHMKNLSDLMLTKNFSLQIELDVYIKLLDLLIIFGFDLIHKVGLYMVDFLKKDTIHRVKKFLKSSEKSEDNYTIAGILSTEKLMKPIKKSNFLNILKTVLKKGEIESFVDANKDAFLSEVKLNLPLTNEHIVVERIERIIRTKQEFSQANLPLNSVTVKKYIEDFEEEVGDAVAVPFIPLKLFLGYKKGKFRWPESVINSFYLAIDTKFRGAIQPVEFKAVITLLSNMPRKEKLELISSYTAEGKSGIVDPSDAVILLEKVEDLVCADLKLTASNQASVSYKVKNKFAEDQEDSKEIPVCDLMDYAKEVAELSSLFSVMNGIEEDDSGIHYTPQFRESKDSPSNFMGLDPNSLGVSPNG